MVMGINMNTCRLSLITMVLIATTTPAVKADIFKYNGSAGDGLWSTPGNWVGGMVPPTDNVDTTIQISGLSGDSTNDLGPFTLNQITFVDGEFDDPPVNLNGDPLHFHDSTAADAPGITNSYAPPGSIGTASYGGGGIFNAPIVVNSEDLKVNAEAPPSFTPNPITFNGTVTSGAGTPTVNVTRTGPGNVDVTNPLGLTGQLTTTGTGTTTVTALNGLDEFSTVRTEDGEFVFDAANTLPRLNVELVDLQIDTKLTVGELTTILEAFFASVNFHGNGQLCIEDGSAFSGEIIVLDDGTTKLTGDNPDTFLLFDNRTSPSGEAATLTAGPGGASVLGTTVEPGADLIIHTVDGAPLETVFLDAIPGPEAVNVVKTGDGSVTIFDLEFFPTDLRVIDGILRAGTTSEDLTVIIGGDADAPVDPPSFELINENEDTSIGELRAEFGFAADVVVPSGSSLSIDRVTNDMTGDDEKIRFSGGRVIIDDLTGADDITFEFDDSLHFTGQGSTGADVEVSGGATIEAGTADLTSTGTLTVKPGATLSLHDSIDRADNLKAAFFYMFVNPGADVFVDDTMNLELESADNEGMIESIIPELAGITVIALTAEGTDDASVTSHFSGTLGNGISVGTGDFTNNGTIRPGGANTPGYFPLTGNLVQGDDGTLEVELGGTTEGDAHDQVFVTDGVTLDGTLDITLIDGFVPAYGDTFKVMAFETRTGTFDTIDGAVINLDGTKSLAAVFGDHDLTLTAAIPGDANLDGVVSIGDLSLLASHFNESPGLGSWRLGDFNFDGQITIGDLSLLAGNFGETNATIGNALTSSGLSLEAAASLAGIDLSTIPEPHSIACLLGGLTLISRRSARPQSEVTLLSTNEPPSG